MTTIILLVAPRRQRDPHTDLPWRFPHGFYPWLQDGCCSSSCHICFKERVKKNGVKSVVGKHRLSQKPSADVSLHLIGQNWIR